MRELREGKYTAPSGTEIFFKWDTASRNTELKTGTYTFPARDGASVQHQGRGAMTSGTGRLWSYAPNYTVPWTTLMILLFKTISTLTK